MPFCLNILVIHVCCFHQLSPRIKISCVFKQTMPFIKNMGLLVHWNRLKTFHTSVLKASTLTLVKHKILIYLQALMFQIAKMTAVLILVSDLAKVGIRVLQKNQVLKFSRAILPKHSIHYKNTMCKIFLKNIDNWGFSSP